jgi:hypothetical protein
VVALALVWAKGTKESNVADARIVWLRITSIANMSVELKSWRQRLQSHPVTNTEDAAT